uniref:Uncharacterized protein n=1 Tax=Anguilla anguilla TaxID=7936 RepID=A0A0E9XCB1_ANGAN
MGGEIQGKLVAARYIHTSYLILSTFSPTGQPMFYTTDLGFCAVPLLL